MIADVTDTAAFAPRDLSFGVALEALQATPAIIVRITVALTFSTLLGRRAA